MIRASLLAAAMLLPLSAQATVLYKSVAANGTVTFSDMPPASGARAMETRVLTSSGTPAVAPAAPPVAAAVNPLLALVDSDAAVAKANAQLDQAERELALARRELLSPRAGLHLAERRMTAADDARVEFFKRNVASARHALMELLRERRSQMVAAAGRNDGSPRYYVVAR